MKNIELKNPWKLNISDRFQKQLSQFDGSVERLQKFYNQFGFDGIPYNGLKRWGLDSSTETSDITYDEIKEGTEMFMRKYTANGSRFIIIRITHKYQGILFYETVAEKTVLKSYIDTGANDNEYTGNNPARYKLPPHIFYPIQVIKPEWVDISSWNAPKKMLITNC